MLASSTVTAAASCLAGLAAGAAVAAAPGDAGRARLLGALVHTKVSVEIDRLPIRDALLGLSAAVGEPIVGRYADDRTGSGIDPDTPVSARMDDVSALLVLEMLLEQAAYDEPVTWQLRPGFIEAGTKERLAAPAAAERRTIDVTDLLLEPPYFATTPPPDLAEFYRHPYAAAAITRPVEAVPTSPPMGGWLLPPGFTARKEPGLLLAEIVEAIVETVEPGNWDHGQDEVEELEEFEGLVLDGDARASRVVMEKLRRRKIARLRIFEDKLVIVAPDFVHRQITGYPQPVAPPLLAADERAARSKRASVERGRITVLAPAAREAAP